MLRVSSFLQLAGLYLFSFCLLLSTAGAHLGLVLILLAGILNYRSLFESVKGQPLFYLAMVFLAFILIRQSFFPVYDGGSFSDVKGWTYLGLYWLVGWALANNQRRWFIALSLVFAAFILRIIINFDSDRIALAMQGGLQPFAFSDTESHIGFSLYCGTILLGWIVWRDKIIEALPQGCWRHVIWLVVLMVILEALVLTNSRGGWVATAAGVMALGVGKLFTEGKASIRTHWRMSASIIAVILVMGGLNLTGISNRVTNETAAYETIAAGELDEIPYSSVGLRIYMWRHAIDMWQQKPWLGWGAGSSAWAMDQATDKNIHPFPHFHSGYLDVLVQFGIVGILLFTATIILILISLWRIYQQKDNYAGFFWFLLGGFVLAAVWNLTNVAFQHHGFRFYSLFMMGLLYAVTIQATSKRVNG